MAAFLNWRMSRGEWATFDAVLSDTVERFLATLGPVERQEFYRALDVLLQDPYPDGDTKVALSFPYRPGTLGLGSGRFFIITYTFLNPATLLIIGASRVADRPT